LAKSFEKVGSTLVPTETNLVDIVWGDERPPRPKNQVFVLEEKYAGRNIQRNREIEKRVGKENVRNTIGLLFEIKGLARGESNLCQLFDIRLFE